MKINADFKTKLSPHLYGPVQSRRHGLSLGVNVGADTKVCSWSCLYCQCGFGRTVRAAETLTLAPPDEILAEIREGLAQHPGLEAVTFAGNSEPGLYPHLLQLIKGLKRHQVAARARWKIVVLSNGSELHREDVLQAFNLADETWLKLDCGSEDAFHRLNRPAPFRHGLGAHLTRLQRLRKLHIQSMLWECPRKPELGNDHPEELDALLSCYRLLHPKKIHLYTIDRDPAFPQLAKAPAQVLNDFAEKVRQLELECEVFV